MLQEFVEKVENLARSVMEEMHTSIPGRIIEFNPETGMATIKPYGRYKTETGRVMQYPTITGVPLIIPQCQSGDIHIAFPIKSGDDCLLIVSEQELDAWLGGGESENDMKFDLTSAVAIPGLSSKGSKILKEACDSENVVVNNGNTKFSITKTGVEVTGKITVNSGNTRFSVSQGGVEVFGNLSVIGDITCTGDYPR